MLLDPECQHLHNDNTPSNWFGSQEETTRDIGIVVLGCWKIRLPGRFCVGAAELRRKLRGSCVEATSTRKLTHSGTTIKPFWPVPLQVRTRSMMTYWAGSWFDRQFHVFKVVYVNILRACMELDDLLRVLKADNVCKMHMNAWAVTRRDGTHVWPVG